MHRILIILSLMFLTYFSVGAYLLYAKLPLILFPKISLSSKTNELNRFTLSRELKNEVIVREYGASNKCIVFFPGRHGGINRYEDSLFNLLKNNGFRIFSISYPGQDGAKGQVNNIPLLLSLISDALSAISLKCPSGNIIYGRSLGATIAAYSTNQLNTSGIILESVAPTLSGAIYNYLDTKWYLTPLKILPINFLLSKDYDLKVPLTLLPKVPISIFQGTNDSQTPLFNLQEGWSYSDNVSLHVIKNGDHSNTYIKAANKIVKVAEDMLAQP